MIIYATKQTVERYKIKMPQELSHPLDAAVKAIIDKEEGDRLLEWGAKLFYFDKRKCLQLVNFASKLTLFIIDFKVGDLENLGDAISFYLFELYKNDEEAQTYLKRMFKESSIFCFSKLIDKSIIATLNHTQKDFTFDGYRFYDFIENRILKTKEINETVNRNYIFRYKNCGKTNFIFAADKFKELLKERYETQNLHIDIHDKNGMLN